MRRQDEILWVYPGSALPAKAFLLTLAEDLVLHFDHARLATFLRSVSASTDRWVRYLSLVARQTLEPEAVAREFGIRTEARGTWSSFHLDIRAVEMGKTLEEEPLELDAARFACHEKLVGPLVAFIGQGSSLTETAIIALGRTGAPRAISHLAALARVPGQSASALLGLSRSGHPAAVEEARIALLALHDLPPPVIATLRFLPSESQMGLLGPALAQGTDAVKGVALASAGVPGEPGKRLVRDILKVRDPWVRAHALHSLALQRGGLAIAKEIDAHESRTLFRTLAVRAAIMDDTPETGPYLLDILPRAPPQVQAIALEGLAHINDAALANQAFAVAVPLLEGQHLRARSAAILLLGRDDPERVVAPLVSLVNSPDPAARLEGAFCLGYLQVAAAPRLLGVLLRDPTAEVAMAAVAGLSTHPAERAVDPLIDGLARPERPIRAAIMAALSELEGEGLGEIPSRANAALPDSMTEDRVDLLRLTGQLCGRLGIRDVPSTLAEALAAPDPRIESGALDGLILSGIGPPDAEQPGARPRTHPAAAARRLFWRLVSGDLEALSELASRVQSGCPESLDMASRFQVVLGCVGSTRRFRSLEKRLLGTAATKPVAISSSTVRCPRPRLAHSPRTERDPPQFAIAPREEISLRISARIAAAGTPPSCKVSPRGGPGLPLLYDTSDIVGAPRWRTVGVGVLLALLVVGLFWSPRRSGPGELAGSGTARAVEALRVVRVVQAGSELAHPGAGQLLLPGGRFDAPGAMMLATSYPPLTIEARPGAGQLVALDPADPQSGAHRLLIALEPGSYRIDGRPGASRVDVRLPWAYLELKVAQVELIVHPGGGSWILHAGHLVLAVPGRARETFEAPARWEGF